MSAANAIRADAPQIISLYRQLLRQARKFPDYNFRHYAHRRTRDAFHEHKAETDPRRVQDLVAKATNDLQLMRNTANRQRQTTIGNFYQTERLVVETAGAKAQ